MCSNYHSNYLARYTCGDIALSETAIPLAGKSVVDVVRQSWLMNATSAVMGSLPEALGRWREESETISNIVIDLVPALFKH